jgi:predicted TIM-barrel fold metal-dependent hydrolase
MSECSLEEDETHPIVLSSDSHVGPRLEQDLRPYCPSKYLEALDEWTVANKGALTRLRKEIGAGGALDIDGKSTEAVVASRRRTVINSRATGHYDVHARLRDMNWDGVAVEIIFHGSQNEEPFPLLGIREFLVPYTDLNFELVRVGQRIYNRWLADFVSVEPNRHVGLAYLPMWDVDMAIEELEWAAGAGLRGVNFPAPRVGIAEYDDPVWEPFWSVCEERGMMLCSHVGVPQLRSSGPQVAAISQLEVAGWPSRRGMHRLIFGGVFERHPKLHLILVEQTRGWWTHTMRELDFAYGIPTRALREQVPRKPSEYMTSNVFVGASFMGPGTAQEAIREGYASNVLWGSDYPHGEGTYKYPEYEGEPSMTRQSIRWAFANCQPEYVRPMLGENGIRAFHLDRDALTKVAARIGPTIGEITTPLDAFPEGWHEDFFGQ